MNSSSSARSSSSQDTNEPPLTPGCIFVSVLPFKPEYIIVSTHTYLCARPERYTMMLLPSGSNYISVQSISAHVEYWHSRKRSPNISLHQRARS